MFLLSNLTIGLIALVAFIILINIAGYFLQERLLFKPEKLPEDFEFKYEKHHFEEYNIEVENGVNINGIHFKMEEPKGIVFYLKGNSRSIKGWGKFAIDFTRLGYDVVMVDYRGFGKSTGLRTEEGILRDLHFVYNRLKEQVDESNIILYGRSLGSGFAANVASYNNPRMLILEAPYYSMKHIAKRFLPVLSASIMLRFPIKTYVWLRYVTCPIHIIHGSKDKLIPYKASAKLSQIKADSSTLHPIIGGGHNNLHSFEKYHRVLEEILHGKTSYDDVLHDQLYNQEGRQLDKSWTSIDFKRKF